MFELLVAQAIRFLVEDLDAFVARRCGMPCMSRDNSSSRNRCAIRSRSGRPVSQRGIARCVACCGLGRFVVDEDAARFRFIVLILGEGNRLRCIADLDAQFASRRRDAEILVAEATDEVKRFLSRFVLRQPKRVVLHVRLDRSADVRCRAEESVGGHETLDALMRTVKVVVLDEQSDSPLAVREVCKHGLLQKLLPERLPESLDLAERLRVLRPTSHVRDAVASKQVLEVRRPAPRRVLPPLVGQDLARLTVLGDATLDGFDDQGRFLVMRHCPRHQIPRVVVEERGHVNALMPAQLEREDVALPHLIRLGAFEATLRLVTRLVGLPCFDQPLLVQNPPHGRLRNAEPFEPGEYVAQSACAPLGIRLA
jgi:hypothetical protein